MWDRIVVISLRRRPERLAAFAERITAAWPGVAYEVFPAYDGEEFRRPPGWKSRPGAWGCYLSHQAVIYQTLVDCVESVLIFEDDVTFAPGFAERMAALKIPRDCEQLYLGGEHLHQPEPAVDGFARGRNVNRTHSYGLIGRHGMEIIRDHLRWDPKTWTRKHHVDHHYGILHEQRRIGVYAVTPWLCGQAAGLSDVDNVNRPDRMWS